MKPRVSLFNGMWYVTYASVSGVNVMETTDTLEDALFLLRVAYLTHDVNWR